MIKGEGMDEAERLLFSKHTPGYSEELMSNGKDSFLEREFFCPSFLEIPLKIPIMSYLSNCHKPSNSSYVFFTSFRDFTFSFEASGFIDTWVKAGVGNKLFRRGKSFHIYYFSEESNSSDISDTFYRFKDTQIMGKGSFLAVFSEDISKESKLLFEEDKFFYFLEEDYFSHRPVLSDRIFGKFFNFFSCSTGRSSGFFFEDFFKFINGGTFDRMSGWEGREEAEDRGIKDIYISFKLWEEEDEEFFDVIFKASDLLSSFFSFSCHSTEFLEEVGVFWENFMDVEEHNSNSFCICFVCFGFSQGSSPEFIYNERVKDEAVEVVLGKEREEVDPVTTSGFLSNEDGVFREGGEFFREGIETFIRHWEGSLEEDFFWACEGTSREGVFGNINAYEKFKVFVLHKITSKRRYKAETGKTCQPILHDDKGLYAQSTYHGLWRQEEDSFEGLLAQEIWSCPALPNETDMGKAHSYKCYNTIFL